VSDLSVALKRFLPQVCRDKGVVLLEGHISKGTIAVPELLFDLAWQALSRRSEAEILEPPELRAYMAERVRKMAGNLWRVKTVSRPK
jgi:hypothetical protein